MPVVNFGAITASSGIQTEVGDVGIVRSLKCSAKSGVKAYASQVGRIRSPDGDLSCRIEGSATSNLRQVLRFGAVQAWSNIRTLVHYFVDATAVPAPTGRLLIPTVEQISNPNASPRAFNGLRFVRGNSVPIEFTLRGQRLDGFNAKFTACLEAEPIGSPHDIVKTSPSSIRQAGVTRDSRTGVETMTGTIFLDPSDTVNLPDGESKFVFEFKVDDSNGRVHTLETGKFTVFTVC
jgi:hypothetical protein